MMATEFEGVNVEIAKDQDQYNTLPAKYDQTDGSVLCCFQLNKEEIEEIQRTGKIWYKQLTFGRQMQPMKLSTNKDEI